jgi:hypothetical protein
MEDWRRHRPKALAALLVMLAGLMIYAAIAKSMGWDRGRQEPLPSKSDSQIIREQADRLEKATP